MARISGCLRLRPPNIWRHHEIPTNRAAIFLPSRSTTESEERTRALREAKRLPGASGFRKIVAAKLCRADEIKAERQGVLSPARRAGSASLRTGPFSIILSAR